MKETQKTNIRKQQRNRTKMLKQAFKNSLSHIPILPLKDPREAMIPMDPIGTENKGKAKEQKLEKHQKTQTLLKKALNSLSDIPIFPLKDPREARIPMDPIGKENKGEAKGQQKNINITETIA